MDKPLTPEEARLILARVQKVKDAGYGKVEFLIQQGVITYVNTTIGEQVKMELK